MTILHRPANRLRPADLIVRHPDHPNTPVEYLIARVTKTANGIEVEYTAPPTGRAKRRAEGLLVLALTQDVAIDARPLGGVA